MNKIISIALLAIGIVLIVYGIHARDSTSSDFSRFFTGSPTDKSIWLMVGGAVAAALGVGGLLTSSKSS
jgi:hypothetical protein